MVDEVNRKESGQTIVVIALLLFGLMAITALAIDGGNALNERRITQNAADASALGGVWYIVRTESPDETVLMSRIHDVVERHGIQDSDGTPGNEVNDNVIIYYTDHEGNLLIGCNQAPCPDGNGIPNVVRGLHVDVSESFPTFIAGVIGLTEARVKAEAVAVIVAGYDDLFSQGMSLFALGDNCDEDDTPFDISGQNNEILGPSHSNSHYLIGSENHFHGQVSYVGDIDSDLHGSYFSPTVPMPRTIVPLPTALIPMSVDGFAPGGDYVTHLTPTVNYFDVSGPEYSNPINEDELTIPRPAISMPQLFNPGSGVFKSGVYYAGDKKIDLSWSDTQGEVTFVTHNLVTVSGSAVHLKNFHRSGILLYTDYQPDDPCTEQSVFLGGSSTSAETWISHSDGCPVMDPAAGCWTPGNKIYEGLVYAPRGKVNVGSGSHITFIGGILAWTIRLSGSDSLYIGNPYLFPPTIPYVHLHD